MLLGSLRFWLRPLAFYLLFFSYSLLNNHLFILNICVPFFHSIDERCLLIVCLQVVNDIFVVIQKYVWGQVFFVIKPHNFWHERAWAHFSILIYFLLFLPFIFKSTVNFASPFLILLVNVLFKIRSLRNEVMIILLHQNVW